TEMNSFNMSKKVLVYFMHTFDLYINFFDTLNWTGLHTVQFIIHSSENNILRLNLNYSIIAFFIVYILSKNIIILNIFWQDRLIPSHKITFIQPSCIFNFVRSGDCFVGI